MEHGAGATGSGSPKAKTSDTLIDVGLNKLIEIVDDIDPSERATGSDETVDQFLAHNRVLALQMQRAAASRPGHGLRTPFVGERRFATAVKAELSAVQNHR
jgi:hypothetical protein